MNEQNQLLLHQQSQNKIEKQPTDVGCCFIYYKLDCFAYHPQKFSIFAGPDVTRNDKGALIT